MKKALFSIIFLGTLFALNLGFVVGQTNHHTSCAFGGSHSSIADHFSHWQNSFCSTQTTTFLFLSVSVLFVCAFLFQKSLCDFYIREHIWFAYIPLPYLERLFSDGILNRKAP